MKLDSVHGLGLIEDQSDLLFAFLGSAPARAAAAKNRLDGEVGIFGSDFNGRYLCQIDPAFVRSRPIYARMCAHNSLTHISIISLGSGKKRFTVALTLPVPSG